MTIRSSVPWRSSTFSLAIQVETINPSPLACQVDETTPWRCRLDPLMAPPRLRWPQCIGTKRIVVAAFILACAQLAGAQDGSSGAAVKQDWPQFRGPDGQGHSLERGLPLEWGEGRNVRWKSPIAGLGWS